MKSLVFGAFPSIRAAGGAVDALVRANVPLDLSHFDLLAPGGEIVQGGQFTIAIGTPAHGTVKANLVGCYLPQFGPVIGMGAFADPLRATRPLQEELVKEELVKLGLSPEDAADYLNAVRQGYSLLGAHCDASWAPVVGEVFREAGAIPHPPAQAPSLFDLLGVSSPLIKMPYGIEYYFPTLELPGFPQFPKPPQDPPPPPPGIRIYPIKVK